MSWLDLPVALFSLLMSESKVYAARPSCAKEKGMKKVKKDRRNILKQCAEQGRWIWMFQIH